MQADSSAATRFGRASDLRRRPFPGFGPGSASEAVVEQTGTGGPLIEPQCLPDRLPGHLVGLRAVCPLVSDALGDAFQNGHRS